MGLDVHNLKFLRYAHKYGNFGRVLTIGRQGIYISNEAARLALAAGPEFQKPEYCEDIIRNCFSATAVESIDNSDYEGASIVHDMNRAVPANLHGQFDTIIDGGCLEHVFNVNQALLNCSHLCRPGGQVLHMLPANNYCGHGFWQFSPELFFSLYKDSNGYRTTEVFLADMKNECQWYKVKRPENGVRVNVISFTELTVLVRTVRAEDQFTQADVQQSDYSFLWGNLAPPRNATSTDSQKSKDAPPHRDTLSARIRRLVKRAARKFQYRDTSPLMPIIDPAFQLSQENPGLQLLDIESVLK